MKRFIKKALALTLIVSLLGVSTTSYADDFEFVDETEFDDIEFDETELDETEFDISTPSNAIRESEEDSQSDKYDFSDGYDFDEMVATPSDAMLMSLNNASPIDFHIIFDDDNDKLGVRPDELNVSILHMDETLETIILNNDNNWSGTFETIEPIEMQYGDYYRYEISSDPPQYYYGTHYDSNIVRDEDGYVTEINMEYHLIRADVVGRIMWIGEDDITDGNRPSEVTVHLYRNGEDTGISTSAREDNDWVYYFLDLDKYDLDMNEYTYTVKEDVPDNYKGYHSVESGSYEDKANYYGCHYLDYIDDHIPDGYDNYSRHIATRHTFYQFNTYLKEKRDISVNFDFLRIVFMSATSDATVRDGIEQIEVYLYADGEYTGISTIANEENDWTPSFTDIDIYNKDGEVIQYSVETDLSKKHYFHQRWAGYYWNIYSLYRQPDYEDEKIQDTVYIDVFLSIVDVGGYVNWEDDENTNNRPESVTVRLYADGKDTGLFKTLSTDGKKYYSFTDLAKYDYEGDNHEIIYSVKIDGIKNYVSSYSEDIGFVPYENTVEPVSNDGIMLMGRPEFVPEILNNIRWNTDRPLSMRFTEHQFDITNTYSPKTYINVKGTKSWNDDDNRQGMRPDSITIHLYADGEDTGLSTTADESTEWIYSFNNLEKFDYDGDMHEIVYSIKEDVPDGYKVKYSTASTE